MCFDIGSVCAFHMKNGALLYMCMYNICTPFTTVPLLPPPSKLKKNLFDGPIQSTARDTSAKRMPRTTQDDSSASFSPHLGSGVRRNKEAIHSKHQTLEEYLDQKSVSDIIGKLNLHSLPVTPTQGVPGGSNKFLLPPPHTAPVTSTQKKFLLPPRGCSLSPAERWKEKESNREERGDNERTRREEVVESGATRRGRQAAIWDELKGSMRLKSESGISAAEIQGEVTIVEDAEGEEMREDAVKNLRVSQPISITKQGESGSVRIKSSWKCYLDGPEEVQVISLSVYNTSANMSVSQCHCSMCLLTWHNSLNGVFCFGLGLSRYAVLECFPWIFELQVYDCHSFLSHT